MGLIRNDMPGWLQTLIAVGVLLVGMALAFGDLKGDLRVEANTREAADTALDKSDQRIEKSVDEIKQMLREEFERHHPRQQQ